MSVLTNFQLYQLSFNYLYHSYLVLEINNTEIKLSKTKIYNY